MMIHSPTEENVQPKTKNNVIGLKSKIVNYLDIIESHFLHIQNSSVPFGP